MEEIDGQPVAVVAVKGTVGLLDWLQNLDDEPKKDKVGWPSLLGPGT